MINSEKNMNYNKIYDALITRGKNRVLEGYKEKHHIVPRCLGGTDDKENLVDLTGREHFIAHLLLVKINNNHRSLVRAATYMCSSSNSHGLNRSRNRLYGWLREQFSLAHSLGQLGDGNSQFGTTWITNGVEEKKIKTEIPDGWELGRLNGFVTKKKNEKKKILKEQELNEKRNLKIIELQKLYEIYKVDGFDGVLKTGYSFSKPNLVMQLSKYLPEFVPQNGKRRK